MGIHNNLKTKTLGILLLFSINFVLAMGVNSPYWDANPLKMHPGQEKEISFTLVEKPTEDIKNAFVEVIDLAGIAELTSGTDYEVVPGTTDTKIKFKVTISETTQIGETYELRFIVKSAPADEQGTVQLGISYDIKVPVEIVEESQVPAEIQTQETSSKGFPIWIILIIIIVIIIILIVFLNKNKR